MPPLAVADTLVFLEFALIAAKPRVLALALALAVAATASPLQAATPDTAAALQQYLRAPHADLEALDALIRRSAAQGVTPAMLMQQLDASAAQPQNTPMAARALLARGWLQWRQGDAAAALATVDAALGLQADLPALRLRAALLDASGDIAAAADAYALAASASSGELRWNLSVHRALASADPAAALIALGKADPAQQHRLAVLLAMLGRSDLALSVGSHAAATGGDGAIAHLRRAVWSLDSGDVAQARTQAWAAFDQASDTGDKRYALALWMEAWRDAGQMQQAVDWLRSQPPQPESRQALVDALLELRRFDEAIALVRGSDDPALRQRLLGILELAGRSEDVAGEYRRQIRTDPHDAAAYSALAAQEMAAGRQAEAVAVFEQLFAANPHQPQVLLPAARQMAGMGLQAQALALLRSAGLGSAARSAVDMFAFDSLLAQGENARAAEVLAGLRARTPAGDAVQADVADGYERLQQPRQALDVLLAMERARRQSLDYDLQVRIANLSLTAGEPKQALQRWRALWEQARLPARRAFLERQIVTTARGLQMLEPMAAALEQQQRSGRLQPAQLDLLVALALALEMPQRAEAAVARQARATGAGRVAELLQLGGLYARLGDGARVETTLRALVQEDPANAGLYLRKLALITARQVRGDGTSGPRDDAQRLQALQDVVAQLQAREPEAGQSLQYAAGLYAMAGLDDAAAQAYERAVALAPDDLDNQLQLAELRKRQQRLPEAVAMLQAAATASDSQRLYIQLVDAIVGLPVIGPGEQMRPGDPRAALAPRVNAWAKRQLLARLAIDTQEYPLYAVLADLAQSQADFPLQQRAYDNALASAGEQRGLVLRQLTTLVSGNDGFDGSAAASIGDNARKVRYARRLLALKREFPPDFFADLGRSLLASGDDLGAERAFAAMSDIGGLVNVWQIKGDAYARAGRVEQALINYSQALARDQDNLDLALKTSILLEQRGENARANYWYWHALRSLLQRQPLQNNGLINDALLDSQRLQPSLLEGLLLTWRADDPAATQAWQQLQTMFEQTLAQADPAVQPLARHDRLQGALTLLQRWGTNRGAMDRVQRAEDAVLARFAGDAQARTEIAAVRLRAGRSADEAAAADPDWALNGLRRQTALGRSNTGLALAIAATNGDDAQIQAVVQDALQAEAAWQRLDARQPQSTPGPDGLYVLLAQGMRLLPAERFVRQIFTPLDATPERESVLFNLYRGAPDTYRALETQVGRPLLDDRVLMRLLVEKSNLPLPFVVTKRISLEEAGEQLERRFDADQRLLMLEQFNALAQAGKGSSMFQPLLLAGLLRKPLTGPQRERVGKAMTSMIHHPADFEQGSAAFTIKKLLILDADPGNRALLVDAASELARLRPDGAHFPGFLQAWFDGDRSKALAQLQALHADTGDVAGNYTQALVARWFPEQRQQRIAAFLANPSPDAASTAAFYREFLADTQSGADALQPAQMRAYLERLVALEPDNETYLASLLDVLLQSDARQPFIAHLQRFVQAHPTQANAAAALAMELRIDGDTARATQVEKDSGIDVDDSAAMLVLINKAQVPKQTSAADFDRILMQSFARFQQALPQAALSVAVVKQAKASAQVRADALQLQGLARAHRDAPAAVATTLRGIWRNASPGARQILMFQPFDSDGNMAGTPVSSATDGVDLLHAVAADPGVVEELERYLRALPDIQRQRAQPLYALVASGLVDTGVAPERLAQLQAQLIAHRLDGHGLQLMASVLVQMGQGLDEQALQALQRALLRMPLMEAAQRGVFAQVFALSGRSDDATSLLRAAALQLLYPAGAGSADQDLWQRPQEGLELLAESMGRWPDRAAAVQCWGWLTTQVESAGAELGIKQLKQPAWLH